MAKLRYFTIETLLFFALRYLKKTKVSFFSFF
jgi:hypothetical protein